MTDTLPCCVGFLHGRCTQDFSLFPDMVAVDNLAYMGAEAGPNGSQIIAYTEETAFAVMTCDDDIHVLAAQVLPFGQQAVDHDLQLAAHGEEIRRRRQDQYLRRADFRQYVCHVVRLHTCACLKTGVTGETRADLLFLKIDFSQNSADSARLPVYIFAFLGYDESNFNGEEVPVWQMQ